MKIAGENHAIASIYVLANLVIQSPGYQVQWSDRQNVFDSEDCSRRQKLWIDVLPGGGAPIVSYEYRICTDQCIQLHPSSPDYYFFCNILAQCREREIFDNLKQKCYYTDTNGLDPSPENDEDYCNEPGIFPVPNSNGAKYSLCFANDFGYTRFDFSCPSWTRFNSVTEMCERYIPPEWATTAKPAEISPPITTSKKPSPPLTTSIDPLYSSTTSTNPPTSSSTQSLLSFTITDSAATGSVTAVDYTITEKSTAKVPEKSTTPVALPEQSERTEYATTIDVTDSSTGTIENITTASPVTGSITALEYTTIETSTVRIFQESTTLVTVPETSKGRNTSPGQQCREKGKPDRVIGVCEVEDPAERCHELICAENGGDSHPAANIGPALDGTWCGDRKICLQGSCIVDTQPPRNPLKIDDVQYSCQKL